jgi:type II secretory pathway pseudopilin PulG
MATVMTRGFTIIELMLFLGITGAIFAALMIGMNNNITQQHYKESVQNYSSLLQNQYSEVANTRIERSNNLRCEVDLGGRVSVTPINGIGDLPGAPSNDPACVILGRAIQVDDQGKLIRLYPVIGLEPAVDNGSLSDIETLVAYNPSISDQFNTTTTEIEWHSSLLPVEGEFSQASYLILRSPASGLIRVFASEEPLKNTLSQMITPVYARNVIKNCVDGQRGLLPVQSVTVNASIAGPDGIVVNGNDPEC